MTILEVWDMTKQGEPKASRISRRAVAVVVWVGGCMSSTAFAQIVVNHGAR